MWPWARMSAAAESHPGVVTGICVFISSVQGQDFSFHICSLVVLICIVRQCLVNFEYKIVSSLSLLGLLLQNATSKVAQRPQAFTSQRGWIWKFKVRVRAGELSGEGRLPGPQTAVCPRVLPGQRSEGSRPLSETAPPLCPEPPSKAPPPSHHLGI